MAVAKGNVSVRWHPQYKPSAKKVIITGYRVYAYMGHPLLGREAKKLAKEMRNRFK